MSIRHHPSDELVAAYAAGALDQGQHIAVATHLGHCPLCRAWVASMEGVGGSILSALPPTPMPNDSFCRIEAQLDDALPVTTPAPLSVDALADIPGLPPFVRTLRAGAWTWVAPGLHLRRIALPEPSDTRVFLLRSCPGVRLLPHGHTGFEMTCVLTGSYSHGAERYGVGDFDFGDNSTEHEVVIGSEGDCVSLIAMQGKLRLKGFLGRLMQSLISI
jgi:putative transcriptional regulator